MFEDYKKRIPQVIFENPDELISGGEHQKLLLDGVDLVEAELNKKADSQDVKTELDKKVDNTSFDEYKKEQELVNDSKVDKESYKQDLDAVTDRINASDAGVSKNKQELNGIKKLLSEAADSSKVVGTAKGGGVITFPSNVLTNASPRYRVNGATDGEFKSVQAPMRIKSVGENLWGGSLSSHLNDFVLTTNGYWYLPLKIPFSFNAYASNVGAKVNTVVSIWKNQYVLNGSGDYKNIIYTGGGVGSAYFEYTEGDYFNLAIFAQTSSRLKLLDLLLRIDDNYDLFMARENLITNKPHVGSVCYINTKSRLDSLNKAGDYIENGKLYKNIKRHYFSKEDEWTLRDDYEGGNYRYYMTLPFEYKATGAGVENELLCNNFTATSNVENALTERESGTIALYKENASTIYLTLDKKVSDVNSIIPEGTFIDVILPQTEVTNLDTSGMVVARPNGTVFIEPVANLTAFYNNGLGVSKLTIEEVESFSTFKDGNYQELDVSKVSIKDGKLTHPDAVNGLCYLVYRHDNAPIYGNNEVDYYNSEKTLKSPNGKVWKKIEEATDEGELVTKLEEVK